MGYYNSHMIGIRTGGVFAGVTDMVDMRHRIAAVVATFENCCPHITADAAACLSPELTGHKGSYVVIAGVFNSWLTEDAMELSRQLSIEFQTEVMHMAWDEERDEVQTQIWLAGRPLFEVAEDPLGRTMRRIL